MNYLNLGLGILIGICIKDPKFRKNLINESNKILKDVDNLLLKKKNTKENEESQDEEFINE